MRQRALRLVHPSRVVQELSHVRSMKRCGRGRG